MLPRTADYRFIYHPTAQKLQSRGTSLKSKDCCFKRVAMSQDDRPPAPQSCQHYTPRVLISKTLRTQRQRRNDIQNHRLRQVIFTSEESSKILLKNLGSSPSRVSSRFVLHWCVPELTHR